MTSIVTLSKTICGAQVYEWEIVGGAPMIKAVHFVAEELANHAYHWRMSADGRYVWSSKRVVELGTGKEYTFAYPILNMAANGGTLAVVMGVSDWRHLRVLDGTAKGFMYVLDKDVFSMAVSPNGRRVILVNDDDTLKCIDTHCEWTHSVDGGGPLIRAVWLPDNACVAMIHLWSGAVVIHNVETGQRTGLLPLDDYNTEPMFVNVAFSPDGQLAAVAQGVSTRCTIYRLPSAEPVCTVEPGSTPHTVSYLKFTPDSQYVILGSSGGMLTCIETATGSFSSTQAPCPMIGMAVRAAEQAEDDLAAALASCCLAE